MSSKKTSKKKASKKSASKKVTKKVAKKVAKKATKKALSKAAKKTPVKKATPKPTKKTNKKKAPAKKTPTPWSPKTGDRVHVTGIAIIKGAPNDVKNLKGTVVSNVDGLVTLDSDGCGRVTAAITAVNQET